MSVNAKVHNAVIRSAVEKDLDKVLIIDQSSFPTPWTRHDLKTALKDIFFVYEKKTVVGYLIACLCYLGEKAEILRLAVHPDHRGRGVAHELLETSIRMFSKENVKEIKLHVNSANRSATKLYEKFGFEVESIATFIADQDFHIFYIMKLKLPEKVATKTPLQERFLPEAYYTVQLAG